jgi:D-glycero-D-manno-heptose 1,7-bisphosphate phosphatase
MRVLLQKLFLQKLAAKWFMQKLTKQWTDNHLPTSLNIFYIILKQTLNFDNSWSLFLDRDGVINEKLENDYVKSWDEFIFKHGALEAIAGLKKIFGRIFIITNQRGVGLMKMTAAELSSIHNKMLIAIEEASGKIDKIYYCTDANVNSLYRKPNIGMGLLAKQDFPEIEFSKSIIVGDSKSDMEFGQNLGMKGVLICANAEDGLKNSSSSRFKSLYEFYETLKIG